MVSPVVNATDISSRLQLDDSELTLSAPHVRGVTLTVAVEAKGAAPELSSSNALSAPAIATVLSVNASQVSALQPVRSIVPPAPPPVTPPLIVPSPSPPTTPPFIVPSPSPSPPPPPPPSPSSSPSPSPSTSASVAPPAPASLASPPPLALLPISVPPARPYAPTQPPLPPEGEATVFAVEAGADSLSSGVILLIGVAVAALAVAVGFACYRRRSRKNQPARSSIPSRMKAANISFDAIPSPLESQRSDSRSLWQSARASPSQPTADAISLDPDAGSQQQPEPVTQQCNPFMPPSWGRSPEGFSPVSHGQASVCANASLTPPGVTLLPYMDGAHESDAITRVGKPLVLFDSNCEAEAPPPHNNEAAVSRNLQRARAQAASRAASARTSSASGEVGPTPSNPFGARRNRAAQVELTGMSVSALDGDVVHREVILGEGLHEGMDAVALSGGPRTCGTLFKEPSDEEARYDRETERQVFGAAIAYPGSKLTPQCTATRQQPSTQDVRASGRSASATAPDGLFAPPSEGYV